MIKEQKGQSMVEFALLLPLVLLLICGIVDIGRLMFAYASLNMTAQEAVRLGGLGSSDAEIETYAKDHLIIGNPDDLEVTISPNESARKSGDNVKVALSYELPMITPIIKGIMPTPILSVNSTIRVE
ncbi:TadE/TadG family type IV pilus assembly protein [Paenibacillus montanisoli]|uniref:Pilus assembly protein n=1 Tax=Paenibacillus montanisoli TaxID=2081970 RepID=A0A328U146_9BACL|nr:TadE family protein [Paenibacillus montanisoli]RAP73726.1 pilus assembly protein [Paenibacillus montanisoli]